MFKHPTHCIQVMTKREPVEVEQGLSNAGIPAEHIATYGNDIKEFEIVLPADKEAQNVWDALTKFDPESTNITEY